MFVSVLPLCQCRAVVIYYRYPHIVGDYRVEERPIPEISEGDVLVKILAVGICAGDAKCFAGAPYFWGEKWRVTTKILLCYLNPFCYVFR